MDGRLAVYRNLMLTMVIGGLWHGAAWTFVAWGLYQGLLLVGHRLCEPLAGADSAARSGGSSVLDGLADRRDVSPGVRGLAALSRRVA